MKKFGFLLIGTGFLMIAGNPPMGHLSFLLGKSERLAAAQNLQSGSESKRDTVSQYRYPTFYRGLYLTVNSANNLEKLKFFVEKAKSVGLNTLVMDVQIGKQVKCMVPASHVKYCIDNGIHPIARIVMFPDGLRTYPISESYIDDRLAIAEDSCANGFKEIQFDYIRFHDSGSTRHLTYAQKYRFIEQIIISARNRTKRYNPRIAIDIFGRVPLNKNDIIGQNMESLDQVADVICPMAYPSHYTWSKKYYADPYFAVYETSTLAKSRVKNAIIVTYIQAFKMKMSGIPYDKYIRDQLRAIHDSGVSGFIFWNARQDYDLPLLVAKNFYAERVTKKDQSSGTIVD